MIKAVIFDMDGILIDSENLWQKNERELFAELGIGLSGEQLMQTRGLRTEEMVKHWGSRYDLDGIDHGELMKRYDDRMVDIMRREVPLMEGALEAIGFFREKKLPVAMATCSTLKHVEAVMERHRLEEHFDRVVSAAHRMQGKPHPEVYLHTAGVLGIDPVNCVAIEDSFFGVISAKAARMKVIAMPDPEEFDQERFGAADLKIRSLREINEELFSKLDRIP